MSTPETLVEMGTEVIYHGSKSAYHGKAVVGSAYSVFGETRYLLNFDADAFGPQLERVRRESFTVITDGPVVADLPVGYEPRETAEYTAEQYVRSDALLILAESNPDRAGAVQRALSHDGENRKTLKQIETYILTGEFA